MHLMCSVVDLIIKNIMYASIVNNNQPLWIEMVLYIFCTCNQNTKKLIIQKLSK